ncbi:HNH endonuclease [Massilia terrae]|uniref:HNH endonuclease n=1 Tax=Massilia terrae TaxID=1811224 RepID=A0ABT2D185_9BURK|nr:HNH endonuclease [Massilia terrae]
MNQHIPLPSTGNLLPIANCWWVNQNQTYTEEISGGFLWSPKTKSNGHRNQFYDYMTDVRSGDIVFSFSDTLIKAVGIATGGAYSSAKPVFDKAGDNWSNIGWFVPIEFTELARPVRPKDHIDQIRPYLPEKYSPLQENGDGLQSVYLTRVPQHMAGILIGLIGREYETVIGRRQDLEQEIVCSNLEAAIVGRTDIGPTMKEQLVKSRRGQGLFKINVRRNEKACRVTGVSDPRNLRASHIKPWKDCTDMEKLNGCNGLLLAPHVDHLFDKGMISFTDNGDLIVSPLLDREILRRWSIPEVLNVGSLHKQAMFLAFHRKWVLKK